MLCANILGRQIHFIASICWESDNHERDVLMRVTLYYKVKYKVLFYSMLFNFGITVVKKISKVVDITCTTVIGMRLV